MWMLGNKPRSTRRAKSSFLPFALTLEEAQTMLLKTVPFCNKDYFELITIKNQ